MSDDTTEPKGQRKPPNWLDYAHGNGDFSNDPFLHHCLSFHHVTSVKEALESGTFDPYIRLRRYQNYLESLQNPYWREKEDASLNIPFTYAYHAIQAYSESMVHAASRMVELFEAYYPDLMTMHAGRFKQNDTFIMALLRSGNFSFDPVITSLIGKYYAPGCSHSSLIDTVNDYGETALHVALCSERDNAAEQLLKYGASTTRRNYFGEDAALVAAYANNSFMLEEIINHHECDPACVGTDGQNVLSLLLDQFAKSSLIGSDDEKWRDSFQRVIARGYGPCPALPDYESMLAKLMEGNKSDTLVARYFTELYHQSIREREGQEGRALPAQPPRHEQVMDAVTLIRRALPECPQEIYQQLLFRSLYTRTPEAITPPLQDRDYVAIRGMLHEFAETVVLPLMFQRQEEQGHGFQAERQGLLLLKRPERLELIESAMTAAAEMLWEGKNIADIVHMSREWRDAAPFPSEARTVMSAESWPALLGRRDYLSGPIPLINGLQAVVITTERQLREMDARLQDGFAREMLADICMEGAKGYKRPSNHLVALCDEEGKPLSIIRILHVPSMPSGDVFSHPQSLNPTTMIITPQMDALLGSIIGMMTNTESPKEQGDKGDDALESVGVAMDNDGNPLFTSPMDRLKQLDEPEKGKNAGNRSYSDPLQSDPSAFPGAPQAASEEGPRIEENPFGYNRPPYRPESNTVYIPYSSEHLLFLEHRKGWQNS
jgi:hypothetical protein